MLGLPEKEWVQMILYYVASLLPGLLIGAGALLGGPWPVIALLGGVPLAVLLDRSGLRAPAERDSPRAVRVLTLLLGALHLGLMPAVMWGLHRLAPVAPGSAAALFVATAIYLGQVGNSNAHELIHMPGRFARRLGASIYTALLFGHHASAHMLVHHVHAATRMDPNSARKGQSFYVFWPRAWIGSFRAGLEAVNRQRARAARPLPRWSHPYLWYLGGAAGMLALAGVIGGLSGVVGWVLLCGYAQMQLMMADYVQHYGLQRQMRPDGKPEPLAAHHSWNAGQVWTTAMMLNAPRHSDHHLHPGRAFPDLRLDPDTMPILPYSLPIMALIAAVPPLWRRIMDPRLAEWHKVTGDA